MIPIMLIIDEAENNPEKIEEMSEDVAANITVLIIASVGSVGIQIWVIYLIYNWSEEWNTQFQSTTKNP